MKKAIVALLTTILATFGYVVADKTMDARISDLEYQVSSQGGVISYQQDEIESLHGIGKYSATYTNSLRPDESSAGGETSINNLPTSSKPDIRQYDYYNCTSTRWDYTRPDYTTGSFFTALNYTSCINDNTLNQDIVIIMTYDEDSYNAYTNSYVYYQISPGQNVSSKDFPIYITSLKTYIYAKEDITREYYDSNMSPTSEYDYTKYRVVYEIEGHAGPEYAGYNIAFNSNYSNSGTINNDGTFSFSFSSIYGFRNPVREIDVPLQNARMWKSN